MNVTTVFICIVCIVSVVCNQASSANSTIYNSTVIATTDSLIETNIENSPTASALIVVSRRNSNDRPDDSNNDPYTQFIKSNQIVGYLFIISIISLFLLIFASGVLYHSQKKFHGRDKPNYFGFFTACCSLADFYSDIMFVIVLLLVESSLVYFALCFTFVPYIISNIIGIFEIKKWKQENGYDTNYISRYNSFLWMVSVLGGFFTTIDFARSKMFYISIFSMQLKNVQYNHIQLLKLLNIVLLELS